MNGIEIMYLTYVEIADELAARPDRNELDTQIAVCRRHGVDLDRLPQDDCDLIARLVAQKMR